MMVALLNNPIENLAAGEDDNEYKRLLMQQLQQPVEPVEQGPSSNQLIASLSSAANQLGTVGGRTAQNPEVQRYAELIDKNKALADQQRLAQVDKKRSLLSELAKIRSNESLKNKELAYRESKDLSDRKFEEDSLNKKLAAQSSDTDKKISAQNQKFDLAQQKAQKPTEAQMMSGYHAARMVASNKNIEKILESGYDPSSYGAAFRRTEFPVVGQIAATPEDRSFEQAAREFIASVLRKETGAAVTDEEYRDYSKMFIPRPGEDKQTKLQKADARKRAIENMVKIAGTAYDSNGEQSSYTWRPQPKDGEAFADSPNVITNEKALEEMSDEELDAELARLGGK